MMVTTNGLYYFPKYTFNINCGIVMFTVMNIYIFFQTCLVHTYQLKQDPLGKIPQIKVAILPQLILIVCLRKMVYVTISAWSSSSPSR